jgi:hypothetical protein
MNNILSNDWINDILKNYSILIASIPYILYKIFKVIAIINPNIESNTIKELFSWKKDWSM